MAGLIRLDENKSWSATGWAFDHVLRAQRIEAHYSKIQELIDRAELPGVNYMSLKNLTSGEIQIFRGALESAYQDLLTRGGDSFAQPESYPGFIESFQELLQMIPKTNE